MTTQKNNSYLEDELVDRSTILRPGEGRVLSIKGGRITLKVTSDETNDQLGVYEISLEPGVVGRRCNIIASWMRRSW